MAPTGAGNKNRPMMLRRFFFTAAAAFLCVRALAAEISLPDSGIHFQAPEGFTELTPAEIRSKWLRASPPTFAIGNPRRSTTIAYALKDHAIPESQMEASLKGFEQTFNRV